MNAFVAFIVIGTLGFTWQDALGAVFWSGILMLIINALRFREKIIKAIPDKLKSGLAAAVGVFLMCSLHSKSAVCLPTKEYKCKESVCWLPQWHMFFILDLPLRRRYAISK